MSKSNHHCIAVYNAIMLRLTARGLSADLQILDNEASVAYKLGWEFRFLVPISGTPIGSGIPDQFPIPKIPVRKNLIKFCC
jgi:hypothetical protein